MDRNKIFLRYANQSLQVNNVVKNKNYIDKYINI